MRIRIPYTKISAKYVGFATSVRDAYFAQN